MRSDLGRRLAACLLAIAAWNTPAAAQPAAPPPPVPPGEIRVTLLGTGSPPPVMDRFGPATLVQAGGVTLLFDAGRGVTQRLWQRRVRLGAVDAVFLTHLHSDHVVGLPDLFLTGWLTSPFGQRPGPLRVLGPPGTLRMTDALRQAFDWDIETRIADQALPRAAATFATTEFAASASRATGALVWEQAGVRVTAFEVDHGDLIHPGFGYRVDHAGHSVVNLRRHPAVRDTGAPRHRHRPADPSGRGDPPRIAGTIDRLARHPGPPHDTGTGGHDLHPHRAETRGLLPPGAADGFRDPGPEPG